MEKLSEILDEFNSINWLNKEKAKAQLEELPARLEADEAFINAVLNSNRETAMQQFSKSMMMIAIQMLNENTEFTRNYLDNPDFMSFINQRVFDTLYSRLKKKEEHDVSYKASESDNPDLGQRGYLAAEQ